MYVYLTRLLQICANKDARSYIYNISFKNTQHFDARLKAFEDCDLFYLAFLPRPQFSFSVATLKFASVD